MISPAPPQARRRTRRIRRVGSASLPATSPESASLPIASLPVEPGGMVDVALRELGARLVAVWPEPPVK
jgi:hypothetical protein